MSNIKEELSAIAHRVPNWGRIQNNHDDNKLYIWNINSFEELLEKASKKDLSTDQFQYFFRRWFLWQCSKQDEALFCKHGCKPAPPKHKDFDFVLPCGLKIDLKGTKAPESLQLDMRAEKPLIEYYYNRQSRGQRYNLQNRLFLVHHSYKQQGKQVELRANWELKEKAIKSFLSNLENINFIEVQGVQAVCIFILESKAGEKYFYHNALSTPEKL